MLRETLYKSTTFTLSFVVIGTKCIHSLPGITQSRHSRFLDLLPELREFGCGQLSVSVAVEDLHEVHGALFRVVQLAAQHRRRLIERYVSLVGGATNTVPYTGDGRI